MAKIKLEASFNSIRGNGFKVRLSLLSFKEADLNVIYSPTLDLFGYGHTDKEAKKSFEITLEEFLSYTLNKGTLEKELKILGWKITGGKKNKRIVAPDLEKLLRDNEQFNNIFNNKEYHKFDKTLTIPELV